MFPGTIELPIRCGTNASRVLQGDPRRQRQRAVLEEVHLQDHLETGRPRSGILQVAQLPRAA